MDYGLATTYKQSYLYIMVQQEHRFATAPLFAFAEGSNLTADSTDDSESSSRNNSNHSDQHGVAANMASQFDQVSQQQIQHKVQNSL